MPTAMALGLLYYFKRVVPTVDDRNTFGSLPEFLGHLLFKFHELAIFQSPFSFHLLMIFNNILKIEVLHIAKVLVIGLWRQNIGEIY